jgi:hypothetical protein
MLVFQWLAATWAVMLPWWPVWAALAIITITTIVVLDRADRNKKGE